MAARLERKRLRDKANRRASRKRVGSGVTKDQELAEIMAAKDDLICSSCHTNKATVDKVAVRIDYCELCKRQAVIACNYGLSLKDYRRLFDRQKGCCAICNEVLTKPHVDHCHKLQHVRGLLCSNCNTGLGFFKDNPDTLIKAMIYLIRNKLSGRWFAQIG